MSAFSPSSSSPSSPSSSSPSSSSSSSSPRASPPLLAALSRPNVIFACITTIILAASAVALIVSLSAFVPAATSTTLAGLSVPRGLLVLFGVSWVFVSACSIVCSALHVWGDVVERRRRMLRRTRSRSSAVAGDMGATGCGTSLVLSHASGAIVAFMNVILFASVSAVTFMVMNTYICAAANTAAGAGDAASGGGSSGISGISGGGGADGAGSSGSANSGGSSIGAMNVAASECASMRASAGIAIGCALLWTAVFLMRFANYARERQSAECEQPTGTRAFMPSTANFRNNVPSCCYLPQDFFPPTSPTTAAAALTPAALTAPAPASTAGRTRPKSVSTSPVCDDSVFSGQSTAVPSPAHGPDVGAPDLIDPVLVTTCGDDPAEICEKQLQLQLQHQIQQQQSMWSGSRHRPIAGHIRDLFGTGKQRSSDHS
ncbi:hypothetical protein GQ42DRAFT_22880, partial [Ramicandelaber brevisporus]